MKPKKLNCNADEENYMEIKSEYNGVAFMLEVFNYSRKISGKEWSGNSILLSREQAQELINVLQSELNN